MDHSRDLTRNLSASRREDLIWERFSVDRGDLRWLDHAACQGSPLDWWAPPLGGGRRQGGAWRPDDRAEAMCRSCSVRNQCLADAELTGDIDWIMRANVGPLAYLKWRRYYAEKVSTDEVIMKRREVTRINRKKVKEAE